MTVGSEARGESAAVDRYATSRAGLFVFVAAVLALVAASGPGDRSWPLRAFGAEAGPWPTSYWWGLSSSIVFAVAMLAFVAARSLPAPGPLVAFAAVGIWLVAQAVGCAIRGASEGAWPLAVVAAVAAAYGVWLLARLRSDDLLPRGGVILAAIFAFAITAALQWIGRWSA